MSPAPFHHTLRERCRSQWDCYLGHPFFAAIGSGELSDAQLRFWLVQDLPYVADYGAARGQVRAKVVADERFGALRDEVGSAWEDVPGREEAAFELRLLERVGGAPGGFGRFDARPAREGYMNHIVRAASEGGVGEGIAALVPCEWGFTEMGRALAGAAAGGRDVLLEWISYYTAPAQVANTDLTLRLLDRAAEVADADGRERIGLVFERSLEHQIDVLDAAWLASDPWPSERAGRPWREAVGAPAG